MGIRGTGEAPFAASTSVVFQSPSERSPGAVAHPRSQGHSDTCHTPRARWRSVPAAPGGHAVVVTRDVTRCQHSRSDLIAATGERLSFPGKEGAQRRDRSDRAVAEQHTEAWQLCVPYPQCLGAPRGPAHLPLPRPYRVPSLALI